WRLTVSPPGGTHKEPAVTSEAAGTNDCEPVPHGRGWAIRVGRDSPDGGRVPRTTRGTDGDPSSRGGRCRLGAGPQAGPEQRRVRRHRARVAHGGEGGPHHREHSPQEQPPGSGL